MKTSLTLILLLASGFAFGQSNLPSCRGEDQEKRDKCISELNVNNNLAEENENKDKPQFELVEDLVDDYQKRSNLKFDKNLNFPDSPREFKYKYKQPRN